MLKRLFAAAIGATAVLLVTKRLQDQRAEQELWAEATDDIRSQQA